MRSDSEPAGNTNASTVDVELFTTPPGWTASGTTLSALSAGQTYFLGGITSRSYEFRVYFTTKDLEGLRSNEVLVPDGQHAKVATVQTFQRNAARYCT